MHFVLLCFGFLFFLILYINNKERFARVSSHYYRGADGVVLVYDVTDMVSNTDANQFKYLSVCLLFIN